MADVFISYAREDEAKAEALAALLELHGLSVWWDRKLQSGTAFPREIERELQAARKVIVIWSPRSTQADWVLEEASYARRFNKLVPVRLELDAQDLPLGFSLLHTIAWAQDLAAWGEIFDALGHQRPAFGSQASRRDCYEVLNVPRDASEQRITAAFQKLTEGRQPGDPAAEARRREISGAYEILKDPQKRAAYDRFGYAAFAGGPGARGAGDASGPEFSASMSDIFADLFGGANKSPHKPVESARGEDLVHDLDLNLEDAFRGKTVQFSIAVSSACGTCGSTGAKTRSTAAVACPTCGGKGRVVEAKGFFKLEVTCSTCGGRGQVEPEPCAACAGTGRVSRERTFSVQIPRGVEAGTRIRLAGEGNAGLRGAPPGDLYVQLRVAPHPSFRREGADLFTSVTISRTTAERGGTVDVQLLDGSQARIKVPAGTAPAQQFRLREKGMPVLRSDAFGDLYVQVEVA